MNLTVNNLSSTSSLRALNEKPLLVQVVVGILLYVNGLMIFTFLKKETFRDTRYILFAQTLFVDSALMLLADLTLMGMFYQYPVHMIPCCLICTLMNLLSLCSPITLVAMCLERYVAICLPLRHASISTPKNTFTGLLIIWSVSFVLPLFILIVCFAYLPPGVMFSYVVCSVEIMLQVKWLADMRAATLQLLFIMMLCFIVSTYIKIMIAARSASSENKKSTNKGLKTVLLHGIQLLLSDITLDPDTSHPKLILSDGGKQVRYGDIERKLPENPKRFDYCCCVLAKEGFSSGRFYFEVQVKRKTDWDLGVARESINRKGMIAATPQDGYWAVALRDENQYKAYESPPVSLSLRVKPQVVGVFVDYEEGLVSFYDVESRSHIYSFTGQTFTEKLYPYFCPCNKEKGKNAAPMIISHVRYNE
ncbi:Zinc-binding protein A33 [Anabarilius grahami]|uniref:Zinc-binding protein A33 n=1 Tax=Anabarilius grahami TaxID=495550 RepID=A0A3N0YDN3_ANAGA|nr:Zinc-binding protein A33 [Anabarilius grahami]